MLETPENQSFDDHSDWAERSEFWIAKSAKLKRKRRVRQRNPNPLILTGHGTSMRIEKGTLLIKQGFSHYPQKAEQFRFFKGDLELPRIIILLDGSGSLSFDVLDWLSKQGVALARIKWDGSIAIYASGAGFSADPQNLIWQFEMQSNEAKRIAFSQELIAQKLINSIATLEKQFEPSERRDRAIDKARELAAKLTTGHFADLQEIRAIEGEAAVAYFSTWRELPMRWKANDNQPIPNTWITYRSRGSIYAARRSQNGSASHPLNAMVNYAYTVKVTQLQIKAVIDGYDPYCGIMHRPRQEFPAYAYDLIEPERPKVDDAVLALARKHVFSSADFVLRDDGVCRLSPQLAQSISSISFQS